MCGIAGIVCRDMQRPVDRPRLRRMLSAIQHRGPDDEGIHVDGNVGLGMRRLSIIDLDGGQQPIFDESRKRVIVFNGEIYNYRELRRSLESRGHRFRTDSDTETVVHLYEDFGPGCVDHLRGMFAFALWDAEKNELLLARDRFGIKPLYISVTEDQIAFSSELKALHAADLVERELDWKGLEGLFRVGYIAAPRTPFKGVQKLEPGHVFTWKPGRAPEIRQYWDVPTEAGPVPSDVEGTVLGSLDNSVRAHLVADVPVAAFLSGGLDSSAVVSSMARTEETVHAFTVRYRGSGASGSDETDLAQALCDRYGIRLSVVDVEPRIDQIFESIVWALDEPHGDESAVPTWLLSERVASEYKVALVGTGGDELFAGYRRHFALGAAGAWQRMPAGVRGLTSNLIDRLPDSRGSGLGMTRIKRFLRTSGGSTAALYLSLQDRLRSTALFVPEIRSEVLAEHTRHTFERHGSGAPADGFVRPALYLDYKTYLPEDLLHLADRISMAHSLELRVPLVDHELVEDLFPLPDRIRVGLGRRPKRILRRSLRDRLPPQHFNAPKRGFVGPTASWLRNELSEMLGDELSPSRVRALGFFDVDEVQRLRLEHAEGRQNHEGVLWALLSFMTWHRTFVESGVQA